MSWEPLDDDYPSLTLALPPDNVDNNATPSDSPTASGLGTPLPQYESPSSSKAELVFEKEFFNQTDETKEEPKEEPTAKIYEKVNFLQTSRYMRNISGLRSGC